MDKMEHLFWDGGSNMEYQVKGKITFFASGVTLSRIEELNGTHPLNTAPPPRVFGYSRTLANVKAPRKFISIQHQ